MEAVPSGSVSLSNLSLIKRPTEKKMEKKAAAQIDVQPQLQQQELLGQIPQAGQANPNTDSHELGAMTRDVNQSKTKLRYESDVVQSRANELEKRQRTIQKRTGRRSKKNDPVLPPEPKLSSLGWERQKPSELVRTLDVLSGFAWRKFTEPEALLRELSYLAGVPEEEITSNTLLTDKIFACLVILETDAFWEHWHIFEKVCSALNDSGAVFGYFNDLTPAQIGYAIKESFLMREKHPDFANEIKLYVAIKCKEDHLTVLPSPLSHFQEALDSFFLKGPNRAAYVHLKVETDQALKEDLANLTDDAVGVAVSRFLVAKFYIDKYPNLPEAVEV